MKIIGICGGTGFLGKAVAKALTNNGYRVRIITRAKNSSLPYEQFLWDPAKSYLEPGALDNIYGLIQLSGESLSNRRWTRAVKEKLYSSRIDTNLFIVDQINALAVKPTVFIAVSGIGIYGHRPGEILNESSTNGKSSFLVDLSKDWENSVSSLSGEVRRVNLRIGLVLSKNEGIIKEFLLPSRLGIAPVFGSGRHIYSWIHVDDLTALFIWLISNPQAEGIYNATAPGPITQKEFADLLARLRGPLSAKIPVPKMMLQIMVGELANNLFDSQWVMPVRAIQQGFVHRFPSFKPAIENLFSKKSAIG
jgi:uncharacterized protein (TIGR01777 family)